MVINKDNTIAIVRLIVTISCAVATTFSWALDADILFNILVSLASIATLIYSWWKNNNVTQAAQEAQNVLNEIKQKNV